MTLIKTSLLNGIATLVKLGSALILNKLLASFVGPAGYAVIGQFQNAITILVNLSAGFFTTGVTKATAQHFDSEEQQHLVWRTAIRLAFAASVIIAVGLVFMSQTLAKMILHRGEMSPVFVWLALALPAMAVNNLLLAIVNGKKEVVGYVIANISGSIISVLLTGILALSFGLYGALVAFAVNPAVVLIATALLLRRMQWFRLKTLLGKIDSGAVRELFGFAIMGGTSALALPLAQILIRDQVVSTLGLNVAGFWQASWKISELYLMLVTTTLSVYYLPRLAEIRSAAEMKIEITKVYGVVLPLVIFGAGMIYILRDFIISLLFTPEFLPMRELFPWQLTGDVIKIGSWVIAYVMLGRAMVKTFVVTEIAFAIVFYCLSILFIGKFGIVGVPLAYAATYLGYWMLMAILLKSYVGRFESVT